MAVDPQSCDARFMLIDGRHQTPCDSMRAGADALTRAADAAETSAAAVPPPASLNEVEQALAGVERALQIMMVNVEEASETTAVCGEAEALRWHLEATTRKLGEARNACDASLRWSQSLHQRLGPSESSAPSSNFTLLPARLAAAQPPRLSSRHAVTP